MTIENFIARIEEEFDDLQAGVLKPGSHSGKYLCGIPSMP